MTVSCRRAVYVALRDRPTAGPRVAGYTPCMVSLDRAPRRNALIQFAVLYLTTVRANYNVICPLEERRCLKNASRYRRLAVIPDSGTENGDISDSIRAHAS